MEASAQPKPEEQRRSEERAERGAYEPPPPTEERTDLGNARKLIRWHGESLRYFVDRRCWLIWDGARWAPDRNGEIIRRAKATTERMFAEAAALPEKERAEARRWALATQSERRINAMISLAESEPTIPVAPGELDADPWLLNAPNGIIDLRSGEISPPDPRRLMTKICGAKYAADARSDLWERFIGDLFGDDAELRAYVQRAMGYALFGAWREKQFWFGFGPPDGGKSTFLGVIGDILGDYHVAADASTWMQQASCGGNRGDVTRLLGARLVTTVEVRSGARFDQALMKKATGGDPLTYSAKYESEIEFLPTFALWFGANDRPRIPDDDDGLWQRLACIPFVRPVAKERQDKSLREKLSSAEHAPAILAWLAAGFRQWESHGLGSCPAVEEQNSAYRRDSNQAAGFFDECLRLAPGIHARNRDINAAYGRWARENNIRHPLSGKALGHRLRALGATGGDDASRVRGERCWHGIELISEREWGAGHD